MFSTPETRWRALQTRDPLSASAFIYGVTTTGIFCRPTCPARLARRANVFFFDAAVSAATAGFRPCRRCRPAAAAGDEVGDAGKHAEEGVRRACEVLREAGGKGVRLEVLASGAGLSKRYFHGVFKRVVGVTPAGYAARVRMEKREAERSGTLLGRGHAETQLLETTDHTPFSMEPPNSGSVIQDISFSQALDWIAIYGGPDISSQDSPVMNLSGMVGDGALLSHGVDLGEDFQEQPLPFQFFHGPDGNYCFDEISTSNGSSIHLPRRCLGSPTGFEATVTK